MKLPILFLLYCFLFFLPGSPVFCLDADEPGLILPDNFSYAFRIAVPLHEKNVIASGFYYGDGRSTYLVTARHVLFAATRVEIKEGARFAVPRHLLPRIKVDLKKRSLSIDGVLSAAERDEMLMHPSINDDGKEAVAELYRRSRRLRLRAHNAIVETCYPGTREFSLGLTRMFVKGLIKYHPVHDVAVIKIGNNGTCEEKECLDLSEGVQLRKPGGFEVIGSSSLKLMDDIPLGASVSVPGYGASKTGKSDVAHRKPLPRRGIVVGKNRGLGVIALDCPAYPGESGGLVIETGLGPRQGQISGIGVMSAALRHEGDNEGSESFSFVVAMDAVIELLTE